MAEIGGALAGRGADEDQAQICLKLVGKFFHRARTAHFPDNEATHSISISIAGFGSACTTQVVRAG